MERGYLSYLRLCGLSVASIEAHASRFRLFTAWCAKRGIDPAMATPEIMREYVQQLYERPN